MVVTVRFGRILGGMICYIMGKNVKYFFIILALMAILVYLAFFFNSTEVFRDTGSFKEKIVISKFGFKTSEIKENYISKFLSQEGVKEEGAWVKTKSWLNGFVDSDMFYKDYRYKKEFLTGKLESWLLNILDAKKDNLEYKETVIKPILLKFREFLMKDDYQGLISVMNSLDFD